MSCKNGDNYFRRFDEYYTKYEHVEEIFTDYIKKYELKDKIIYCPCDSEQSNFVIWLKEHKDEYQYKELIYTCDDYNTHLELFEYCDIIITNPPFSKLCKEFIPILNNVNKKFFILGSKITLISYFKNFDNKNIKFILPIKWFRFDIPEDYNLSDKPSYIYITNIDVDNHHKLLELYEDKHKETYIQDNKGNKYLNYNRLSDIPKDIDKEFYCPITVLFEHNRYLFDIIKPIPFRPRNTYMRILVKRKINI